MKKLSEKQSEFSQKVAIFLIWIYSHPDWSVTLGEAWRPPEMQEIYLKQGKTKVRHSKHQDRLAIDLNLFIKGKYITDPEKYHPLGEFWELLGGIWGGRFEGFKDANHFEYKEVAT